MSEQTLCRAVVSLLALVLLKPVVALAGEVTDVRYTVEMKAEMSGVPPSPTPAGTTYSVKGDWQRIDSAGHSQYTILQCDLARLIVIDPDRNTCCVYPLYRGGAQSPTKATTTAKGGVVVFEGDYRDTGERQEMFGLKARRVKWKQVTTADANTCSQHSSRFEYTGDAWIADMPPSMRPFGCTLGDENALEASLLASPPGCKDEVQTKITGDPKLLLGLMLSGTSTSDMMRYTTKAVFKTTELSTAPLDPAIFQVPKGCTCPTGLAAAPSGPTAEKKTEPPLKLDVRETATEVKIALSAEILFDFDKATLRPAARDPLEQVATLIRKYPDTKILVEGHTDALGSDEYNLSLSRRRSDSVRDWLVQVGSVPSARIETRGLGKSRPVAPNTNPDKSDNPEGRQKNRRVEITVKK